jgi:hypothetical protein
MPSEPHSAKSDDAKPEDDPKDGQSKKRPLYQQMPLPVLPRLDHERNDIEDIGYELGWWEPL